MDRIILRDDQWERIAPLLPGKSSDCGVTAKDNRSFLEAVLWIARTGAPWRDLPSQTAELTGLNRNTVNRFLKAIRIRLAEFM